MTDDQRIRHGYQRAVLANETGVTGDDTWLQIELPSRDYYAARIGVYRAIAARRLEDAIVSARRAVKLAGTIADRVDATLDLLFTLFCGGDWKAARATALDALVLVEETQGDRAAGGILFLLACLSADDGQWTHAIHLLERLRSFYSGVHDVKRLARQIDLKSVSLDDFHIRRHIRAELRNQVSINFDCNHPARDTCERCRWVAAPRRCGRRASSRVARRLLNAACAESTA